MALATVKEQLELPGGVAPRQVRAVVELIDVTDAGVAYTADGEVSALWSQTVTADAAGLWQVTSLRPNVGASADVIATPGLTAYRVRITAGSTMIADWRTFRVIEAELPEGGVVWLADLLEDTTTLVLDGGTPSTVPVLTVDGGTP